MNLINITFLTLQSFISSRSRHTAFIIVDLRSAIFRTHHALSVKTLQQNFIKDLPPLFWMQHLKYWTSTLEFHVVESHHILTTELGHLKQFNLIQDKYTKVGCYSVASNKNLQMKLRKQFPYNSIRNINVPSNKAKEM